MEVSLNGMSLVDSIAQDLAAPGMTPVLAIERALEAHLHEQFKAAFAHVLVKPPKVKFHSMYFKQRYASLPALLGSGYETWYPEITLSTGLADAFDQIELSSESLGLLPISYGGGVSRVHQLKRKDLKRQSNHVIRINHIKLGSDVIRAVLTRLEQSPPSQPLISNLDPLSSSWGLRIVSFDHMLTGERFVCDCSKAFHESVLAAQEADGYLASELRQYLPTCAYKACLCHLCIAKQSPEDDRYGASIETKYESYLDQVMFDLSVDQRTARAEVMHVLGLSKWRRESTLYGLVRELFPDHQVLREASPKWLGRMRLDIYLPELKLAIEHHGEQHYRPLAVFGGDEAHKKVVERDALKRKLCAENGIEVVDFRFDAPLTNRSIKQRLLRFLRVNA
ncbi:hypothetical protein CCOS865_02243 [Pseudomonas reidholzensis]|uniref:Uncharacterized protein n=2 Tax=Pseudomonas reidholzensis TaxID=1785162 RepID=A0A383RSC6_9PSED|nr:hypothetical protein CCOS865_02243 [Pseudomonas reidholzensis]